jgi:hypothetical protein
MVEGRIFFYPDQTLETEIVGYIKYLHKKNTQPNSFYLVIPSGQISKVYSDRQVPLGDNIELALKDAVDCLIKEKIVIVGPESKVIQFEKLLKRKKIDYELAFLNYGTIKQGLRQLKSDSSTWSIDLDTAKKHFVTLLKKAEKGQI